MSARDVRSRAFVRVDDVHTRASPGSGMLAARTRMKVVGRYRVYEEFAAGGMASIHFGKLGGEGGFSRLVAVKRMHPQFTNDAEFVKMFMDEARVAGRIQHPNVVSVIDVVRAETELLLVMDYVHGESLSRLLKIVRDGGATVPPAIAARLAVDLLQGLHAAHEATGEFGARLEIVHRDVSPQNLLVGIDGIARVVDFGVAKAEGRMQETVDGSMKGKLGYFSPEQLQHKVDRRTDVFAAAIVLWETLRARRLFTGDTQWEIAQAVLTQPIVDPSTEDEAIPHALGAVVMKGLARDVDARFQTAREMAVALEASTTLASHSAVADWVRALAGASLDERRERIARSDELESDLIPPRSVGRRSPVARSDEPVTTFEHVGEESGMPSRSSPRLKSEAPPPVTRRPSARTSTALIVIATAGVTLGIAGLAFGYALWARDRPIASAVASDAPPASSAAPSSDAASALVVVASASAAASASTSASASIAPATVSAPHTGTPRRMTPLEEQCKTRSSGVVCGGECFNGRSREHCGRCNNKCGPLEACEGGKCVTPKCTPNQQLCPNAGCVDVFSFLSGHCGACGKRCYGRCVDGVCDANR